MKDFKLFPLLIILLHIGASLEMGVKTDWKMAVYYMAGAILNIAVNL